MQSNFKQLLIELGELSKTSKANAFRRAEIIVSLVRDSEYALFLHSEDEGRVRMELARYISDLAVTVDEIIAMYDFAPNAEAWVKTSLIALRDAAFARRRTDKSVDAQREVRQGLVEQLRRKIETLSKQLHDEKAKNRELTKRLRAIEKSLAGAR